MSGYQENDNCQTGSQTEDMIGSFHASASEQMNSRVAKDENKENLCYDGFLAALNSSDAEISDDKESKNYYHHLQYLAQYHRLWGSRLKNSVRSSREYEEPFVMKFNRVIPCPRSQRIAMTLIESGDRVTYTTKNTYLPDQIDSKQVSLEVQPGIIIEQYEIICQYIVDEFAPHLMPKKPLSVAKVKIFIDISCNQVQFRVNQFLSAPDQTEQKCILNEILFVCEKMELLLEAASSNGPYLLDASYSLAEICGSPLIHRMVFTMSYFYDVQLFDENQPQKFRRLKQWLIACLERPSYRSTQMSEKDMIDAFKVTIAQHLPGWIITGVGLKDDFKKEFELLRLKKQTQD